MIHRQAQDCEYLLFEQLSRVPRLVHGIFTRRGGFSAPPFDGLNLSVTTGDDSASVRRNRAVVAVALGLPLVAARPVHGDEAVVIDEAFAGGWASSTEGDGEPIDTLRERLRGVTADAMVTNLPGFALCWGYGDCAPILLADPRHEVIALVHAGWRGAAHGIIPRTIEVMRERFGTQPDELLAGIGPAIGACCYAVSEEVRAAFAGNPLTRETPSFAERNSGDGVGIYLDVGETSARQLRAAGIPVGNIEGSGYCTGCSPDLFYSNRRGPRHGGRFGVAIGLRRDERQDGRQDVD